MADYRLSVRADEDLGGIYEHTFLEFGEAQADAYYAKLVEALEILVASPHLGRSAASLHPGLHRYECGLHSIFYTLTTNGIFVVRVLHQGMEAERHL